MQFSKLGLAKLVVSGLVGIGTGKIVAQIIKTNISPETLIEKVTVTAAAWVIGAIATEATKSYTNEMIDHVASAITIVNYKFHTGKKLGRITRGESTFEKEGLDPKDFKQDDKNRWIFKDDSEEKIDVNTVVGMIRSGDWTYDAKKDVWVLKNGTGRAFQQIKRPDGTAEWVWGKIVL